MQVPVTVRVTTTRMVEVIVPVEQRADIDPSDHDWPDVTDLYDRARQLVREGEGEMVAEGVRVEGWRAPPSGTGDRYWRPSMFGGRL